MENLPVNETKELKWKLPNGKLISIKELSEDELSKFRKVCAKRVSTYFRNYEFFTDILSEMDKELKKRTDELESKLKKLKQIETEV